MGRLDGRVAIVTGASRGIGEHIAERFAAEGAAVAVVARTERPGESRLPGSLHDIVERIRSSGGVAAAIAADLSVPESVETVVARAEAALGPVDTLVNNAGVNFYGPALELSTRRYDLMFEVMVHSTFRLCQRCVPGMVERGRGWVLNITSKQARHPAGPPYPDWSRDGCVAYGMCKAAIDRLSTGLAAELHGTGVNVNSLGTAGLVITPGATAVSPHTPDNVAVEPDSAMSEAALLLCTGAPGEVTGRIAYSMDLLGNPIVGGPWALTATF
jgi:NAD(P)-dependent dehydrogenase (short-subunit alcohol dehydrogenase family)